MKIDRIRRLVSVNSLVVVLIIIAVVSEMVLLRQNSALKKQLQASEHLKAQFNTLRSQQQQSLPPNGIEASHFPVFSELDFGRLTKGNGAEHLVLFYFDLNSCNPCVQKEIKTWNKFATKYNSESVQVIGITELDPGMSATRLMQSLKVDFPLVNIESLNDKLTENGIQSTPAVLFGESKTGKCIYAFFPNSRSKSEDSFVDKLHRFLNPIDLKS